MKKLKRLVQRYRDLQEEQTDLKLKIRELNDTSGLTDLRQEDADCTQQLQCLRDELVALWDRETDRCVQEESSLPSLPVGVSFFQRKTLVVTDAAALPREALEPKQSLLKANMPGVAERLSTSLRIGAEK